MDVHERAVDVPPANGGHPGRRMDHSAPGREHPARRNSVHEPAMDAHEPTVDVHERAMDIHERRSSHPAAGNSVAAPNGGGLRTGNSPAPNRETAPSGCKGSFTYMDPITP